MAANLHFVKNGEKYVSTINRKNNAIGFVHKQKPYIVGFANRHTAVYIKEVINREPDIHIMRRYYDNVTQEINEGLNDKEIDFKVSDVYIDIDARISIMKKSDDQYVYDYNDLYKTVDDEYIIDDVLFEQFILYPFHKCLGVALATNIWEDKENMVVLSAQIIDPCDDVDMFRKRLTI
jgi:hypothetical protein